MAFLLSQGAGQAAAQIIDQDPLPYTRGYLVTGNYVTGGIRTPTGTIQISGVPADADVVAAFLYWETIHAGSVANPDAGATFEGQPITRTAIRRTTIPITDANTANCWGAASSFADPHLTMFRADVVHLLPKRLDASGQWTGKYLVNGSHPVLLPDISTGNNATQSGGAGLVIVFRDASEPLRKIAIFDGIYTQLETHKMVQTLRGFYQSTGTASRLTHLVASGGQNNSEILSFKTSGAEQPLNASGSGPFTVDQGAGRTWNTVTIDLPLSGNALTAMPGVNLLDGFGETVSTSVVHTNTNQRECLAWAGTLFSTAVADADGDGLPDGLEGTPGGLKDPPSPASATGHWLPDLYNMGARVNQRDLFVEVNGMWAAQNTQYGDVSAPASTTQSVISDPVGHSHMPPPDVVRAVALVYLNPPAEVQPIVPHFDVGDPAVYRSRYLAYVCPDPAAPCTADAHAADPYLVPANLARGGEIIKERTDCTVDPNDPTKCQFGYFPGTVGWRFGYRLYKNAPVKDDGSEVTIQELTDTSLPACGPDVPSPCFYDWYSSTQRRRFDPNRRDYFHYLLYAHARGAAKSTYPCLAKDQDNNYTVPSEWDATNKCTAPALQNNPDFHVPKSVSGIAELPGRNGLITLGMWDNFVGTTYVQSATTLHELGHNLNLWHGGAAAIFGDATKATYIEPNCKPNYLSTMSYLFQIHGLFDADGNIHLDYSRAAHAAADELSLSDGPLSPSAYYRPAWYAPVNSPLALTLGVSKATRFCSGGPFGVGQPTTEMARVYPLTNVWDIAWNAGQRDPITNAWIASNSSDVNFDGVFNTTPAPLNGFNDWANLRLDQIGAARNILIRVTSWGDLLVDPGSGDVILDPGSGDVLADPGAGDVILDPGSGDLLLDPGSGDVILDPGAGDVIVDPGSGDILLDPGAGDVLADPGSGDILADPGSGDLLVDPGSGDVIVDPGAGDVLVDPGAGGQRELDLTVAKGLGRSAPVAARACVLGASCPETPQPVPNDPLYHSVQVRWNAPTFGHVKWFRLYRLYGDVVDPTTVAGAVQIGSDIPGTQFYQNDTEELPNGYKFTYFVKAEFDDDPVSKFSGPSNFTTVTVINDAPVAVDDPSYTLTEGTKSLTIAAPGILGNDSDDDTGDKTYLRVASYTQPASGTGTVSVAPDGSFVYTPDPRFIGVASFTYKANDGVWVSGALSLPRSLDSNSATVTITILKKTKR